MSSVKENLIAAVAQEQLSTVQTAAGFLATSWEELALAHAVVHHKGAADEPEQTSQAVLTNYHDFYVDARSGEDALQDLDATFYDLRSITPGTSLRTIEQKSGQPLGSGLGELARFVVLSEVVQGKRQLGRTYDTLLTPHGLAAQAADMTQTMRLHQARPLLGAALEDQVNRHGFWLERLQHIRRRSTLGPLAASLLKDLGAAK